MRTYNEVMQAYHEIMNEMTKPTQHMQNKAFLKERLTVLQWIINSDSIDAELVNNKLENKE